MCVCVCVCVARWGGTVVNTEASVCHSKAPPRLTQTYWIGGMLGTAVRDGEIKVMVLVCKCHQAICHRSSIAEGQRYYLCLQYLDAT